MRRRPRQPSHGRTPEHAELQVSIFVRAGDTFAGRPISDEIIDRARSAGLSGATAVRGLQGFGASTRLRSAGVSGRNGSEPVLIEITDDAARVRAFLPVLELLLGSGLVVLKTVSVTRRAADVPEIAATVP